MSVKDKGTRSRYKVLIYDAAGRQALPVCKGFYECGCEVTVYCRSKYDTGFLTRYKHRKILFDRKKHNAIDFIKAGKKVIKSGYYDLVVPMGDEAAKFLSKNKRAFKKFAHIAVNSPEVFQYAIDKSKTMDVCKEYGINAPVTYDYEMIKDRKSINGISFPVVVKPKTSVGSIGFNVFSDYNSLIKYIESYDGRYGDLLIQEYVCQGSYPQYRADLFRDRDGVYRAAIAGKVTRWYPLDGGSGIYAETIHDSDIIDNCKKLLDAINWNGYANIDMVWDEKEGKAKILEINGRTGASIMLDYQAGINVSRLIMENELNLPMSDMIEYKDGIKVSCLLADLLWFVKSPNRFSTRPSWFRRKGIKDVIFSFRDPLPSIGFLITSIGSFKNSMKARRRA